MAEPDRPRGDYYHRRERQGQFPSYHEAARFAGAQPAAEAYTQAQDAIYAVTDNDLSVYRIIYRDVYHVAVLGQLPPDDLRSRLHDILSTGQQVELPSDMLNRLAERRALQIRRGNWSEGHYRPGRPL